MLQGLNAKAGLRQGLIAGLSFVVLALAAALVAPAGAYPASQAEAQFGPPQDPYTFPSIKLCCEPPKGGHKRKHWQDDWRDDPWTEGHGDGRFKLPVAYVNCGEPNGRRFQFRSLDEALSRVANGGRVVVDPDAACDVSGTTISRPVTVQGAGSAYGVRSKLTGGSCLVVAPGQSSSEVRLEGLDIETCVLQHSGKLELLEVNASWRGPGAALRQDGGELMVTRSTVRARDIAVDAAAGLAFQSLDSGFATTPEVSYTVRLNTGVVQMRKTLVKGGTVGLFIERAGSQVELSGIEVLRAQAEDPFPPSSGGNIGILIGGAAPQSDLPSISGPWTSGLATRQVSVQTSLVAGYQTGIAFGGGSRGYVGNTTISKAQVGIGVATGALVTLDNNTIETRNGVGIQLEPGARGTATGNRLNCKHGNCVCYGGECDSSSNESFGSGLFVTRNTYCND